MYFASSFLVFLATRRPLCRVSCVGARPGRPEDITASSHLALSPASGPRSQAKAGAESRDEARGWCGGEAAPIRGQRSKGSPLSYPSSNRRREITIGNTIWNACLLHGQEIKKAIETQSLKFSLYRYCTPIICISIRL